MSFQDVIKNSILEGFNTDISTAKIIITLLFASVIGVYIFFVYKYKSKSSFYSKDFNAVLAGLPLITAGIVLAMQSNIVISLGMVGALSIVRFRNAARSSLDLLFLFWSISIGIICGAGLYEISIILSAITTILLIVIDLIPNKKKSLLLIINANNINIEKRLIPIIKDNTTSYRIKSRSISKDNVDLIIEIRSKNELELVSKCSKLKNVLNVNLLSHDGEMRI